ncbi:hypothetical protein CU097_007281 [Rhizopus azygosporus]|uniref:MICOS complex subunit MIC12 n=1 Tax=Rhizopus azygosporus TaxID=86630 RepID=A0A367JT36_RHIAZ|nr:hypothetical protein CU097_007281 [Rhizopus azygosporus]CEG63191.1 hypothetical protein RMATCC62417_00379 [Rhizopus microsporus]CEG78830.1 hypothetical protein RMATCC62417_13373 [Rhizopus microsporus]CEI91793.1 hypothetical protein RMCBS344292_06072 [Rhizopus microsporus]
MPRFIPLVAGIALATLVTVKVRDTVSKDQNDIQQRLDNVKSTLNRAVAPSVAKNYVSNSQKYVSDRLIPSVKDSWNNQVINATHSLVKLDIGSKVKKFVDEQIFK